MRGVVDVFGRRGGHRQLKEQLMIKRTSVAVIVLLICTISLFSTFNGTNPSSVQTKVGMGELWGTVATGGWRPSSAPGADWPPPPNESNGYLLVRCIGDLTQQRAGICDAVLTARIMNATLVLPELDSLFWHDNSGFKSIFDVEHFIKSLRYDVRIVESLPEILTHGEMKKMEAYWMDPPPNAPLNWYATVALEKMKEHGAIYLTSFSHCLEEEINNHEFQRLRCRVNYHALRFKPQLLKLSNMIVSELRSQGNFLAIHLRFETMLVSQCYDIFTPEEQEEFLKYRAFLPKRLLPRERRALGECPLTPEEVGLILRAMRFNSSTRIYLTAGKFFGGERYMKPFRTLFPHLENHSTVVPANEELTEKNTLGMLSSAVDYMVCIQADIFIPTYDGPDYFANTVMGHRLYHGFRTTLQPDRKALAPIFINRKKEKKNGNAAAAAADFEEAVRRVMFNTSKFGRPHKRRVHKESFYTNPWPDCFCQISAPKTSSADNYCPVPPENVLEVVNGLPLGLHSEETPDNESIKSSSNSTSYAAS